MHINIICLSLSVCSNQSRRIENPKRMRSASQRGVVRRKICHYWSMQFWCQPTPNMVRSGFQPTQRSSDNLYLLVRSNGRMRSKVWIASEPRNDTFGGRPQGSGNRPTPAAVSHNTKRNVIVSIHVDYPWQQCIQRCHISITKSMMCALQRERTCEKLEQKKAQTYIFIKVSNKANRVAIVDWRYNIVTMLNSITIGKATCDS